LIVLRPQTLFNTCKTVDYNKFDNKTASHMHHRIKEFIEHQTCSSITCVDENGNPYSFTIFYAFNIFEGLLYFKSPAETKHAAILKNNPVVSGTILPDRVHYAHIKGIQFEGLRVADDHAFHSNSAYHYYNRHPYASAMPGEIWTIQMNKIKFTESIHDVKEKISWKREEEILIHQ
jgi:uncharacterized protein